jgi:type IV pilus assembly protein PilA
MSAQHGVSPEEIMALADGELRPELADPVFAHIASCPECREIAQHLEESRHVFAAWAIEDIPRATADKIEQELSSLAGAWNGPKAMRGFLLEDCKRYALVFGSAGFVILFLIAISVPNLLRSRFAANEASAVGSLRVLNTAAATYVHKYGHYPLALENFGPPRTGGPSESAADLIDSVLAAGTKLGYFFAYRPAPGFDGRDGYFIKADPVGPGMSGARHFSTDQTGVIRMNGEVLESTRPARNDTPDVRDNQDVPGVTGPMVARSAELKIIVAKLGDARESVNSSLARHRGYVAQLSISSEPDSEPALIAALRVPSDQLDPCVVELRKLGRVVVESQAGEAISQQHLDLVARLNNARNTETRINEIIQRRTGSVKEVLEAESEAARVRGEIERMDADRKTIESRVSFAMISLKLSEEYKAKLGSSVPSAAVRLRNALIGGLCDAWELGLKLLIWLFSILPSLLLSGAILFLPFRWGRRRWYARTRSVA